MTENFLKPYSSVEMKTIILPKELNEISGLEWVGEDELWAVEDESGMIYKIDQKTGEIIEKMKFGKKADFEDLVVIDGTAWVLQSNGDLYRVRDPFGPLRETTQFKFPTSGNRDMEALLISEKGRALWIFCKDCELDKGSEESSVFRFDLETLQFTTEPIYKLKGENFKPLVQNSKTFRVQPSAAAFHPSEKKIYMISSSGNWLAILDEELNPLESHWLDPKVFKQPEGITFDREGNLYLSNEAAGGQPTILIFPFEPLGY